MVILVLVLAIDDGESGAQPVHQRAYGGQYLDFLFRKNIFYLAAYSKTKLPSAILFMSGV
ncbi:hypothetical protein [Pseudomonas sp. SMV7]|uniref:hypothetical protein n=1 Tax=Pseudomonas sp. SMV7 TaxID=3390194 RepID=UPI003F85C1B5